jgi:pimeloyl-ACP methyl ester carboxylesterase
MGRNSDIPGLAGRLRVDDGGRGGVPVVFVHAFAGNLSQWSAQLAHLRPGRRAIAFDLRGHGGSQPPRDRDYAIDSLAEDIGAVADGLALTHFVLVGHSLGGAAAIAFACARSDRVAGLVLVGAPGKVPDPQAREIMTAMRSDYEKTSASFMERLLGGARPKVREQVSADFESIPQDAALKIMEETFAYDPVSDLAEYSGPKVLITAAQTDSPNDLHHLRPDLPHHTIAGASHWVHMDKPEEFDRLLDEFLAGIDEQRDPQRQHTNGTPTYR